MTMISTRNVDTSKQYQLVQRNAMGKSSSRHNDAMQHAIDEAVRNTPGGEYMMNAIVYVKGNGRKVKVEGDVWGLPAQPSSTK
jgi:hypothetical protein